MFRKNIQEHFFFFKHLVVFPFLVRFIPWGSWGECCIWARQGVPLDASPPCRRALFEHLGDSVPRWRVNCIAARLRSDQRMLRWPTSFCLVTDRLNINFGDLRSHKPFVLTWIITLASLRWLFFSSFTFAFMSPALASRRPLIMAAGVAQSRVPNSLRQLLNGCVAEWANWSAMGSGWWCSVGLRFGQGFLRTAAPQHVPGPG